MFGMSKVERSIVEELIDNTSEPVTSIIKAIFNRPKTFKLYTSKGESEAFTKTITRVIVDTVTGGYLQTVW